MQFQYKDAPVGPPLTKSAPASLAEANVTFGIAIDDPGMLNIKLARLMIAKCA
jgi:hypothetical protein